MLLYCQNSGFSQPRRKPCTTKHPIRQMRSLRPATCPPNRNPGSLATRHRRLRAGDGRPDRGRPQPDGRRAPLRPQDGGIHLPERTAKAAEPKSPSPTLMRALRTCRRTVQRYLRQLEHAGYIGVEVIHARTRMCAGCWSRCWHPLFPRHHRQKWPQRLIEPDAARESQNNRLRD